MRIFTITCAAAVMMLAAVPQASAYDFMADGLAYLVQDSQTVWVTSANASSPRYSDISRNLVVPDKVTHNDVTFSVTGIDNYAFMGCEILTHVLLPNSLTMIGNSAFSGCVGLVEIAGGAVQNIGDYAFNGCVALEEIDTSSATRIGNYSFAGCSSATSVFVGDNVSSIGTRAFADCSSLASMGVGGGNATFDSRNNCNAIVETASTTLIAGCQATRIPDGVTRIGNSAFYGCTLMNEIYIPESVTSIGYSAFEGCSGLQWVEIPAGVTYLDYTAFGRCTSLRSVFWKSLSCDDFMLSPFRGLNVTSFRFGDKVERVPAMLCSEMTALQRVEFPASLTSIGRFAFNGCNSLDRIVAHAAVPQAVTLGDFVFRNVSTTSCTLYVPAGTTGAYQSAAQWHEFSNVVEFTEQGDDSETVILDKQFLDLEVGQMALLSVVSPEEPGLVAWTSNNAEVATVDANGMVKAIASGNASVTARLAGGRTAWCAVTVRRPGDVNGDGEVTIADVTRTINIILSE